VDVDDANLPVELVAALITVLAAAVAGPVRLSTLLDEARAADGPDRLGDTVWAACLWVWLADSEVDDDAQPSDAGLAQLLAGLAAVDDGVLLADAEYAGPDLLVGPTAQLAFYTATAELQETSR
jgi:hypothetical protein